ncbi:hypothetical protein ROLI_010610 [Roseobacter fucihabitans]|uniref:Resolvase n=1 Tax=Roseobacter fucihabitans TaxID=1537242 RepID=A0ABZ2BPR2_9RHOB|nr:recombinase family protein [Roseobacter litoralis]MBC6965521.1 hypothetical protein [Roseobacter litoralis]
MNTPKAIIYCRVSSKGQETDGHGLESQETRCRQYAKAKGYDVAAVFPDTMTGGGSFMKRPGMVALLSFLDAQPNEKFVIIFDDLKRFARDREFHFRLRQAFRDRQARLECLNFSFDETPEGEFVETIFAAQGQLERKQNARQVSQKMKARMQSGYFVHRAPVGYRYEAQKGRGKILVPNAPLSDIIREAFEGYASGRFQTQAEVKRFFEGFTYFPHLKKGRLTQQRVTDILTHPIYTGHICSENYGINWLKGQHDPLISLETFDKVQERRAGKVKAPKRKNIGDTFALRGIACCAACDVPLRSSFTRGNGGQYAYYLCQTKGCEAYGKSIKRDKIEGDVGEIIKTLQPNPSAIRMMTDMFRQIWEARRAQAASAKTEAKKELSRIDKRIDALLGRIVNAQSDAIVPVYEGEIVALERGKAILAEQMQKQAEPKGSFEEKLEPAIMFLASPWKIWETPGSAQVNLRRLVLKLALKTRIKYCRNDGARTPEIAFPFKSLGVVSDPKVCFGALEQFLFELNCA